MDVPFLLPRLTCLGQIYVLEVSLGFIFGLECCGSLLFAAPAFPDSNPVISKSPWKPLSVPEQAFWQSTYNASVTHPSHGSGIQTVCLASESSVLSSSFSSTSLEACGRQSLLLVP